jgi:hypothetical protein
MKNLIYAGSSTSASVAVNGVVPITTVVRKFNRNGAKSNVDLVGNAIAIESGCTGGNCRPRYNGYALVTFAGATTGNAVLSVYEDNTTIPFANASETIATASTEYHTVTIPFSVLCSSCSTKGLTLVNTGAVGLIVINASILVIED